MTVSLVAKISNPYVILIHQSYNRQTDDMRVQERTLLYSASRGKKNGIKNANTIPYR